MRSATCPRVVLPSVALALCAVAALVGQDADQHAAGHGDGASLELWIPAGSAPLRALIVDWASQRTRQDERTWIEAARAWGCAWAPSEVKPGKRIEGRYAVWRALLAEAAKATGRPEVATLPILLITAQAQVDRGTIGPFASAAGVPLIGILAHAALGYPLVGGKGDEAGDAPMLSVSGEEPDAFNRFPDLRTEFRPFRQADKPWALGLQPFADHEFAPWIALQLAWCREVLDTRIGAGGAARPTDLAAGWLGSPLTDGVAAVAVAAQASFAGDRSRASWFPGPRSAALWAAHQNAALGAALRLRGAPAHGVQIVAQGAAATWTVEGAPDAAEVAWFLDEERVATGASYTFTAAAPGARTLRARCGERDVAPLALVVPAGRQIVRHRIGAAPSARPAAPAPAPLAATAEQLAAARDAVAAIEARLAAAQQRAGADEGWSFELLAEGLADGDDAILRLPWRGGAAVAGCATVPAWRQETLGDGWSYAFRNGGGECRRDKLAFAVATDRLRADAARVQGALRVDFRRDRRRDERLPVGPRLLPGMPTAWSAYDVFAGEVLRALRPMDVTVELARENGRWDCELRLPGGAWDRPVELRFAWPPRAGESPAVRIEGYNAGSHRADVAGLAIADGRIRGDLVVTIQPDPWVPQDRITRSVTYAIDLPLAEGGARGVARASGDLGEARVDVVARVAERWSGRYRADGGFGPAQGALGGRRATLRAGLGALSPLPAGGDDDLRALLARGVAAWRRLRSLELAAAQPLIDVDAAATEELLPLPAVADATAAIALLQEHRAWSSPRPRRTRSRAARSRPRTAPGAAS